MDKRLDTHESSHPATTGQINVVGGFKVIAAVVLSQFCAETDRRYAVAGVVLAPLLVNVVELLGTDGVVRLEAEIALGLHEVDDIVAAALDGVHVGGGSFADREAEIVLHQPVQPFQTPEQDALQLGAHLLHKEGVVCAVGGLVLGGQDELAAKEAVRMVIQRGQRAVAETEEPGVNVPLVALDTLALQVQLGLGGHDGLDIIRLGQGVHVHVIVDHQQAAFQIGTGKAIVLDFLDAAIAGGVSHEPFQHQPDSGFALAALADNEHHLLPLGAGDQAVAQIFLQGVDVSIVQQLVQKGQPAVRAGGFGVVLYRQTVLTEQTTLLKRAVRQMVHAVVEVDAVLLDGERVGKSQQLDGLQNVGDLFGQAGGDIFLDVLQDALLDLTFVLHRTVQRVQRSVDAFQRPLFQKGTAKLDFVNFLAVVPVRP